MTDRAVAVTGAGLAGVAWIGVLTALLWSMPPDHMGAALLLGLHSESPPFPFTIQNVMWLVFFLGFGELAARHRAGGAEDAQLARGLLPEDDRVMRPVAEMAAHGVSPGLCCGDRVGAGVAGSGPAADSGGLAVAPGLPSTPGPPPSPPPVTMAASRPWRLAVVAAAVAVAGLAWPAGGDAAPETTRTAAGTPGGENARRGDGGGVGGAGVAGAPPAGPPEAAQGGAARDRADSDTEPDESSAQEDPAPAVPPEAVEAALGLDSAGWLEIQKGLVALGLDPGTPDGRVGGGTRGAVRAYQEGAGKPAAGFVDAADVTTLRYAASEAGRVEEQRLAEEMERQRPAEAAAEAERRRQAELRRPGRVFRDCDSCPELVVIPAGTFQMGSPASEEGRYDNEGPRRRVTLRSFAMGVKEVTFDEWDACVRGGGCYGRPDDEGWGRGARPVINVSTGAAQRYVSWLSEITGARYRLPSESEWEYAARAGTTTPFHTGSTISTDQANYNGNHVYGSGRGGTYRERTTPVGTFAPNAFGLYDMHGNVYEWVEDCWHDDYRGAPSDGTAWTRGGDCRYRVLRVLRGGSWFSVPRGVRSAFRNWYFDGGRLDFAGFRVSRTLD